jgi:anaerobic magnesium-protoporphyrin IX monomethyl ester cyclase
MDTILFTHSYFLRFDPKQWSQGQPYAPLGTLYAASLMRENGYKVTLFDTMFSESPEEILPEIKIQNPSFLVIYDDGFNYLTKMCLTNMREAAYRMCKIGKENNCIVVVSSSDSTDRYEDYLNEGADFVIIGEAEHTLLALIDHIKAGGTSYDLIEGLAYRNDKAIIKTRSRAVLKDLDSLPLAAWDLVKMDAYKEMWMKNRGYFSINMNTTRGCPFKCNWCAKPIYGNRYNSRRPQQVVNEIKYLKQNYNMDHIWFCDDIFGLKPGWVQQFSQLLDDENLKIKFKIQSRADLLVQQENVIALTSAGCEDVWIGAESGSQKILDAMDKGITVEQIVKSTSLMKEHGIRPSFFIQFGYPDEEKTDIQLTINMINELLPYEIGISVSYPLPGTVFYERVKAELKKKTNWTDSNEMALLFSNKFRASYYKQLHVYVHQNYHKHLAKSNLLRLFKNPRLFTLKRLKKAISILYYTPITYLEKLKLDRLES